MQVPVVGFIPPVEGVDAEFNTFRLGSAFSKRLKEGDEVFLMDEKSKTVFGRAAVTRVETGVLGELCLIHAKENHRERNSDPDGAAERLFKYLQKVYGSHIATLTKKSTVIYMRRLE